MIAKSIFAPLLLIVLGALFLLSHLGPLFARWLPLILIAVGLSMLLPR